MQVIATAGHVDHGKSALVAALTGMQPDRLAEERRRGLSIDLGYVWTTLPGAGEVAFVDVPGHHRFLANMLAGVGPLPAVLFVVAADGGWAAQSSEHLAALHALGVRESILAVTRCDLADPAPATRAALAQLAMTSLGRPPVVAVSAVSGAGLDDLRVELARLAARLPAPPPQEPVRLWVDRRFSPRGAGTVLTGTLPAGRVRVGDTLELTAAGAERTTQRVRGLQSLQLPREEVCGVARVGVNLRGAGAERAGRGDALLSPGAWLDVRVCDATLVDAWPGAELAATDLATLGLVLHVGTAAVPVRLRTLGPRAVRLHLPYGLPLRVGDRALLRDPGAHRVLAGLEVADVDPPALTRRGAAARRGEALARGLALDDEVCRRGAVRRAHLERARVRGRPGPDVRQVGEYYVWGPQAQRWQDRLCEVVTTHARAHPLDPGVPPEEVRRLIGVREPEVFADCVARALAAGALETRDGRLWPPGVRPELPPALRVAAEQLAARLEREPFRAPEAGELAALGLVGPALAAAERSGLLWRLASDVVLAVGAPARAAATLAGLPAPFTAGQARQAWGTSRRVAIPLLEYLDRTGVTVRIDANLRRLR